MLHNSNVTTVKLAYFFLPYHFSRFPNISTISVRATGLQWLGQLHSLAELRGLTGLTVLPEGNPIDAKVWREYAVYRLAHWGLKQINDEPVRKTHKAVIDNVNI